MKFISQLKKSIVNMPGWRTKKKIVVVESDDWGSIAMPSKDVYDYLLRKGLPVDKTSFAQFDSLESEDDLNELFHVLSSFKDQAGNHPSITACAIVANPVFEKIRESGMNEYYYEPFTETYKRYPNHNRSFEVWKNGMELHLLWPQLHGREHLNPMEWLKALQSKHPHEIEAFNQSALLGLTTHVASKRFMGYLAAFDYEAEDNFSDFEKVISEAQELFTQAFNFSSKSFVAPTGIRSDRMDEYLARHGILYHQLAQQFLPYNEARYAIRNRFFGSRNEHNQIYWRRNGMFEPSRNQNYDWVNSVLREMHNAFMWRKPFVLSSHRVNFIGGIVKENRERSLVTLNKLLKAMLSKYPDLHFMSSDQLGDEMRNNQSFFLGIPPKNFYYDIAYKAK